MDRLQWYFDPLSPHQKKQNKKKTSNLDPLWQNFLDPRMGTEDKLSYVLFHFIQTKHKLFII